ncbi:hypothetical protein HD806DRAFT_345112 [Xylariaceae sp. AK1471]|nr:hypothetical protein HD806DRAFT_345112 [Xylariaceae sp. AK1471]
MNSNATICSSCRLALRRTIRLRQQKANKSTVTASLAPSSSPSSRTQPSSSTDTTTSDLASLLSQPTWSVRSLLPPSTSTPTQSTPITPQTLHHLLRLSALPNPQTPAEESQMLATLSSQLHFVRAIQSVDTTNIMPLRAIRDETAQGLREQTIGLAELRDALEAEDVVGHARRPRRRRTQGSGHAREREQKSSLRTEGGEEEMTGRDNPVRGRSEAQKQKRIPNEEEDWDVLGGASETAGGRYFVVRSGGTGALPSGTVG